MKLKPVWTHNLTVNRTSSRRQRGRSKLVGELKFFIVFAIKQMKLSVRHTVQQEPSLNHLSTAPPTSPPTTPPTATPAQQQQGRSSQASLAEVITEAELQLLMESKSPGLPENRARAGLEEDCLDEKSRYHWSLSPHVIALPPHKTESPQDWEQYSENPLQSWRRDEEDDIYEEMDFHQMSVCSSGNSSDYMTMFFTR